MPTMTTEELVESGKFVWNVNRLILHPDFEAELYRNYPQQSMEDGLLSVGISPADMGYHKIYWLQEKFEHSSGQDTNRSATRGRTAYYTAATVEQYRKHPYVQTATREKIELNKAFFEAAAPIAVLAFDDILRVFDIDSEIFSVTERYRMSRVLAAWATPADRETINASPTRKILRNRMRALDSIVEKGFLQIGDIVSSLNVLQKKSLCLWLRDLPPDPGRKYSVRKILSLMKISRASHYAILKNDAYGQSVVQRSAQDEQDAELIRTVIEYKGFAKGSRQIYMMSALTGKRMGLKKIRRIMKAYNLTSSIRKAAPSKRMGGAALKKNVRPNLLQRRFRLYRPNEVRLTDGTHLLYGDGYKAYGSALLDPVTSKLVAFLVSEHNDLELALATLRQSDLHPCVSGGLYHSDQRTVYLSGAFQQEVSKRGYTHNRCPNEEIARTTPHKSLSLGILKMSVRIRNAKISRS